MKKGATLQAVMGRSVLTSVLAFGVLLQGSMQAQTSGKRPGIAQQVSKPEPKADKANKVETPLGAGGPKEGIQVHGHWVIDVRNPDGKLVTHREFENSYVGTIVLGTVLGRSSSVGLWTVTFANPTGRFAIVEPQGTSEAPVVSNNLSVQGNLVLTLTGSFTATTTDNIGQVQTLVGSCSGDVAPASCQQSYFGDANFTQTYINPPIPFVSGQIVQVTVTISFH